jgi:hypothetical protein
MMMVVCIKFSDGWGTNQVTDNQNITIPSFSPRNSVDSETQESFVCSDTVDTISGGLSGVGGLALVRDIYRALNGASKARKLIAKTIKTIESVLASKDNYGQKIGSIKEELAKLKNSIAGARRMLPFGPIKSALSRLDLLVGKINVPFEDKIVRVDNYGVRHIISDDEEDLEEFMTKFSKKTLEVERFYDFVDIKYYTDTAQDVRTELLSILTKVDAYYPKFFRKFVKKIRSALKGFYTPLVLAGKSTEFAISLGVLIHCQTRPSTSTTRKRDLNDFNAFGSYLILLASHADAMETFANTLETGVNSFNAAASRIEEKISQLPDVDLSGIIIPLKLIFNSFDTIMDAKLFDKYYINSSPGYPKIRPCSNFGTGLVDFNNNCYQAYPTEYCSHGEQGCTWFIATFAWMRACREGYYYNAHGTYCETGRILANYDTRAYCDDGGYIHLGVCYRKCDHGFFPSGIHCVTNDGVTLRGIVTALVNVIQPVIDFVSGIVDPVVNSIISKILEPFESNLSELVPNFSLGVTLPSVSVGTFSFGSFLPDLDLCAEMKPYLQLVVRTETDRRDISLICPGVELTVLSPTTTNQVPSTTTMTTTTTSSVPVVDNNGLRDASAWACVKVSETQESYLAVRYESTSDKTFCVAEDGANCRWHSSLSVCNSDKNIVTSASYNLNPYSEPAAPVRGWNYWPYTAAVQLGRQPRSGDIADANLRDTSSWSCVCLRNEITDCIALRYNSPTVSTMCLSEDGAGCRWRDSIDNCKNDINSVVRVATQIMPYSESSSGYVGGYWPATGALVTRNSFRVQQNAGLCIVSLTQAHTETLTFGYNCDAVATVHKITFTPEQYLVFTDGRMICPENQLRGSKLRGYSQNCEAKWQFLPNGLIQHLQTFMCVHPITGGNPSDGETMVLWDDCNLDRSAIRYRAIFA